jgi:hypothetical protein
VANRSPTGLAGRAIPALVLGLPLALALVYAGFIGHAVQVTGDSPGYVYFAPGRPVGYPAFLALASWIAPHLAAVPVLQAAAFGASLGILGLAVNALVGRLALTLVFELLCLLGPAVLKSLPDVMSDALTMACFNLFAATVIFHFTGRLRRAWVCCAVICFAGLLLRPANLALAAAAIIALVLAEERRLLSRRAIGGAAAVLISVVLAQVVITVAARMVNGPAPASSPLARGLLQKTLFQDWPDRRVRGVDARDSAFISRSAAQVDHYLTLAPADVRDVMEQPYSDYLRFQVIIPQIAGFHGFPHSDQTDPIVSAYAVQRIAERPAAFIGGVWHSYWQLLTYGRTYTDRTRAGVEAFMLEHPLVILPPVAPLGEGIALESRLSRDLGRSQAGPQPQDDAARLRASIRASGSGHGWPLVVMIRSFAFLTAFGSGAALLYVLFGAPGATSAPLRVVAVLGATAHGLAALTAVSEFALARYMAPVWPSLCVVAVVAVSAVWPRSRRLTTTPKDRGWNAR